MIKVSYLTSNLVIKSKMLQWKMGGGLMLWLTLIEQAKKFYVKKDIAQVLIFSFNF